MRTLDICLKALLKVCIGIHASSHLEPKQFKITIMVVVVVVGVFHGPYNPVTNISRKATPCVLQMEEQLLHQTSVLLKISRDFVLDDFISRQHASPISLAAYYNHSAT